MTTPASQEDKKTSKKRTPLNRRLSFWLLILLVVVTIDAIKFYRLFKLSLSNKQKAVPVVIAPARQQDIPVTLAALGVVTPVYSISIFTQINGILIKVLYKEGQMVKAGQLLAEIDPRPYEALLLEYEGQLIRDKALLANALIDLKRYQKLWKQDSISQQTLATQEALVRQYEGNVQSDLGLIQTTKVNLIYCKIISPVDGRIGLRLVDPGNFVQTTNTTPLAIVNTINPITVIFTLPEDNIPDVVDKINAGKTLTTYAYDRSNKTLLSIGSLLTIDNQVDTTTGTVKLRANFDNKDNHLFPNQFVNIQLLVDTLKQAITIPTAAIQFGTNNQNFVYVLGQDNKVNMRPVQVSLTTGDITVIQSGLKATESVVTEGTDNLVDGMLVTVSSIKETPTIKRPQPMPERLSS